MDRYNSRMFSTSLAHSDRPASGPIYRAQFLKQDHRDLPRQSAPPAASKWLERKLRPPSRTVHEPDHGDARDKKDNSKDSEENRALQSLALDYIKLKRSVAALEKRISLLQAERPLSQDAQDGPTQLTTQPKTLHKQNLIDQDNIKQEQIDQIDQIAQEPEHPEGQQAKPEPISQLEIPQSQSHSTNGNAQLTDLVHPTQPPSLLHPSHRAAATESLWHRRPGSKAAVLALAWAVGMLAVALLLQ
uniref:ARAD1D15686p n=1 Tax=Blastobotrys adeninivorans TaxID=409370 RepID=A0A060T9J6_BLAAD